MRILFTGLKTRNLVNMNVIHYLEQEVSKLADCDWSGPGWENHVPGEEIDETVRRLYGNDPPDFIVCNRPNIDEYKRWGDRKTTTPPIISTLADLHVNPQNWVDLINRSSKGVLMRYLYSPYIRKMILNKFMYYTKFDESYCQDNINVEIMHFPWFTDKRVYKPNAEKEHDVIFLGAYRKKVYPLRNRLVSQLPRLCEEKRWNYIIKGRPPGISAQRDIPQLLEQGYIVGEKYAETIAKSKIFIFGNSIFRYPLTKYFEIMGSGTLVMANKPQSAEYLHLEAGENYVEIDKDNWKEKLTYYLEDDAERERIARNGYETMMKYHTSEVRAIQLLGFLENLQ